MKQHFAPPFIFLFYHNRPLLSSCSSRYADLLSARKSVLFRNVWHWNNRTILLDKELAANYSVNALEIEYATQRSAESSKVETNFPLFICPESFSLFLR